MNTLQRSEQQQFLFQCGATQLVRQIVADVAAIHNLRQTVTKVKLEGTELAKHGPAKKPDQQGIDTYDENPIDKGEFYQMDPTGRRTGNGKECWLQRWLNSLAVPPVVDPYSHRTLNFLFLQRVIPTMLKSCFEFWTRQKTLPVMYVSLPLLLFPGCQCTNILATCLGSCLPCNAVDLKSGTSISCIY